MKIYKFFMILLLLCVMFSSCETRGEPQPVPDDLPESADDSKSDDSKPDNSKPDDSILSEKPAYNDIPVYNVPVKSIADSELFIAEVEIPKEIEAFSEEYQAEYNRSVSILHPLDNNHVLLRRQRKDEDAWIYYPSSPADIVVYNFITGEWDEPLNSIEKDDIFYKNMMWVVYIDENYCIVSTTTDPMAYTEGKLILFDLLNNTYKVIFEYYYNRESDPPHYTGYHPNNITIWENQVYFDDFVHSNNPVLYAYNIESGELRIVSESAMNPIVYRNEIWFFTPDEDGVYRQLQSESGNDFIQNNHQIGDLVSSNNKLFTIRGMGEDEALGTSLTGVFEWDSDTAVAESRRGNILTGLQANRDFIAWHTSMPHQPPCIYDFNENILYEFTGDFAYERCDYTFYLNGNAGLLYIAEFNENYERTGNEKYLFFSK